MSRLSTGGFRSPSLCALLVTGIVLTACGTESVSPASPGASVPGASQTDTAALVQEACDDYEATTEVPPIELPTEPVDASAAAGKTVWRIVSGLAVQLEAQLAEDYEAVAEELGVNVIVFDGKGQVNEWLRGMTQAVAAEPDAILLASVHPQYLEEQLAEAAAKGIPVIDEYALDPSAPNPEGIIGHVSIDFVEVGKVRADYAICQSNGEASVLIVTNNAFQTLVDSTDGATAEFERLCPNCSVTVEDTQNVDMATAMGPRVISLIRRDPSITYVFAQFDGQVPFILPLLHQEGLADAVEIVGSDLVGPNLDYVRGGDVQTLDCGAPVAWMSWAAMDLTVRALTDSPAVQPQIPFRCFTADNLPPTNDDAELFPADFRSAYRSLWGLD